MSTSPIPGRRSSVSGILLAGVALFAAGCHHRTSASPPPSADDSVNVGYAVQTREQVGGAVQSITAEELATAKVRRVEELLAGRVAGVRVLATPNGGFAIRIRGASTFRGDNEPLYIVNGMAVQIMPGEGLSWLNPDDIERIDILKDPAETAMYGVRGANGVILIKMKR